MGWELAVILKWPLVATGYRGYWISPCQQQGALTPPMKLWVFPLCLQPTMVHKSSPRAQPQQCPGEVWWEQKHPRGFFNSCKYSQQSQEAVNITADSDGFRAINTGAVAHFDGPRQTCQ